MPHHFDNLVGNIHHLHRSQEHCTLRIAHQQTKQKSSFHPTPVLGRVVWCVNCRDFDKSVRMGVVLLSGENAEDFLNSRSSKALLFTKKAETPQLWLRVSEALEGTFNFGEVRHVEENLLLRFGVDAETLPRIVVVRDVNNSSQTIHYEGPTTFERISDFLRDIAEGGPFLVEARKQALPES